MAEYHQYAVDVACPVAPPPSGWDELTNEQRHLAAKVLRHAASVPGFLGGAQVSIEEDSSMCMALFLLEDNCVTVELLRALATHQAFSAHVLTVECDMTRRPVLNPHQMGAIMLYLRTTQYNNAHPGRAPGPSLPAATTAVEPLLVVDTTADQEPVVRALPDVPRAHVTQINALADSVLLLQGADFQPQRQSILCTEPNEYELRTFGFARPITISQLDRAARMPAVKRAHVSFYLRNNDEPLNPEGCLIVLFSLPPPPRDPDPLKESTRHDDKRVRARTDEPALPEPPRSLFSYFSAPEPPAKFADAVTAGAPTTQGAPPAVDDSEDDALLTGVRRKRSFLGLATAGWWGS